MPTCGCQSALTFTHANKCQKVSLHLPKFDKKVHQLLTDIEILFFMFQQNEIGSIFVFSLGCKSSTAEGESPRVPKFGSSV